MIWLRIRIWWANFKYWLYEVTHEQPDDYEDDEWVEKLKYWRHVFAYEDAMQRIYRNGHLYQQHWDALRHSYQCPCKEIL